MEQGLGLFTQNTVFTGGRNSGEIGWHTMCHVLFNPAQDQGITDMAKVAMPGFEISGSLGKVGMFVDGCMAIQCVESTSKVRASCYHLPTLIHNFAGVLQECGVNVPVSRLSN